MVWVLRIYSTGCVGRFIQLNQIVWNAYWTITRDEGVDHGMDEFQWLFYMNLDRLSLDFTIEKFHFLSHVLLELLDLASQLSDLSQTPGFTLSFQETVSPNSTEEIKLLTFFKQLFSYLTNFWKKFRKRINNNIMKFFVFVAYLIQ